MWLVKDLLNVKCSGSKQEFCALLFIKLLPMLVQKVDLTKEKQK